ncbi:MAG: carboxylesterase family protein [Luteimonas sp.]|nr:carboxylesterase family protein [Luteimonas sp.]
MRLLLSCLACVLSISTAIAAAPQARIAQGALAGEQVDGIAVFRGIPFAGDAGGEHRWRPPTPAPHWQGVRDATRAGPICPQSRQPRQGRVAPWLELFEMGEDCLNLAVYSPDLAGKAPVMVWIHGGLARIGTGSRHDAVELAQRGVVVVTINYRLDRLGLFAHPALTAGQPGEPLGNYGVMDMQAALHWVRDNIGAFGGDPGNVTIFGQSSGGVAVTALMGSPLSQGLFHRAIAQSGSMADLDTPRHLGRDLPRAPSLESDGVAMARALLPEVEQASAAQLRALPWQAIIGYTETQPPTALVPVIDGKVLPESVMRRFAAGRQVPVPLMIGTTSWEESLFVHFAIPLQAVLGAVPAEQARAAYPGLDDKALVDHWLADTGFHAPARMLANASVDSGQPTWVYRFDHLSPAARQAGQPGAAHGDDVPYLFAPLGLDRWPGDDPVERAMQATVMDYWTRFARSGDPNGGDQPAWPAWRSDGAGATQLLEVPARAEAGVWKARMEYHLGRYARQLEAPAP